MTDPARVFMGGVGTDLEWGKPAPGDPQAWAQASVPPEL